MKRTFCGSMSAANLLQSNGGCAGSNPESNRLHQIAKSFVTTTGLGSINNNHQVYLGCQNTVFEYGGEGITPLNRESNLGRDRNISMADVSNGIQIREAVTRDYQIQLYRSAEGVKKEDCYVIEGDNNSNELRFQEFSAEDEDGELYPCKTGPSNYKDQIVRSPSTKVNLQAQTGNSVEMVTRAGGSTLNGSGNSQTQAFPKQKSPSVCVSSSGKKFINPEYYKRPTPQAAVHYNPQQDKNQLVQLKQESPIKILNDVGGTSVDEGNVSEGGQSFSERKEFCQTVATQPARLNDGSVGVVLEMNDFQQYIEYGNYTQFV